MKCAPTPQVLLLSIPMNAPYVLTLLQNALDGASVHFVQTVPFVFLFRVRLILYVLTC